MAQVVEGFAQCVAASLPIEEHGQFDGVESLVADVAEDVELGVVEYGVWQTHHLAVGLVGIQYTRSHTAYILREAHHQFLSDGVDGRVGDLGKLLTEIVEENLRSVGEYRQWRIVAHRGCRFLSIHCHGDDGGVDVFCPIAKHDFLLQQVVDVVCHVSPALQFLQLDAVGAQPLPVGIFAGQLFLDFTVIVDPALLGVDKQDFPGLQTSFLCYLCGVEIHYANLRRHHHGVVLRDGVSCRAQSIPVEHAAGKASVAEKQGCRTVPRFHQYGVVFIEGFQVFRDGVLVVERFWHQHAHGMGQRQSRHDEELQHVVE